MTTQKQFSTIDEYISACPADTQVVLEKIRQTVHRAAPEAVETISYKMPAFELNGKCLVYLAAWKSHISMYPVPGGTEAFKKELSPYIENKSTIKLPLNKPIPYDLVEKIVQARVKQNLAGPVV